MNGNRTKAADILVESLKLYVSLSTLLVAGLLAYYSSAKPTESLWLMVLSFTALLCSAVMSIVNLNHLIYKVYDGDYDITRLGVRVINIAAIALFFAGIAFGILFLYINRNLPTSPSLPQRIDGIRIEDNTVIIGNDVETKVIINRDASGNIAEVKINN